jgi:hypothetical protein
VSILPCRPTATDRSKTIEARRNQNGDGFVISRPFNSFIFSATNGFGRRNGSQRYIPVPAALFAFSGNNTGNGGDGVSSFGWIFGGFDGWVCEWYYFTRLATFFVCGICRAAAILDHDCADFAKE